MLDATKSLPEDPTELRAFTALLLAEVKSQAILIEKLSPLDLPAQNNAPRRINRMRLKNRLGQVEADCANLSHG